MREGQPDFSTPLAEAGYPLIKSVSLEDMPALPLSAHRASMPKIDETSRTISPPGQRVNSWSGDWYGIHENLMPAPPPPMPMTHGDDMRAMLQSLVTRSGKLDALADAAARYFSEANQNASASYLAQGHEGTGALGELWFLELWLLRAHVYAQMLYWITGDLKWDLISDDYLQVFSLVSGGEGAGERTRPSR